MAITQRGENFPELVKIIQRLLAPDGCPWDHEQTLQTLKPYLIEEAYEVLEAVDRDDPAEHCEELGDLLFQILFQAELRAREGGFGINDVIEGIRKKMVSRHPHVFGDVRVKDAGEALENWAKLKAAEHERKGKIRRALDGVPADLPALLRAQRIGEKAAQVGFDWPDLAGVRAKVTEELGELDEAIAAGDPKQIEQEVGDLLFALSRLATRVGVGPEEALRGAIRRFSTRFEKLEDRVAEQGAEVAARSLAELDRIWTEIKREEAAAPVPKK